MLMISGLNQKIMDNSSYPGQKQKSWQWEICLKPRLTDIHINFYFCTYHSDERLA